MSTQFINRLKSVMAEHKITQTELAKRTGIRQSSISDWLNNRYLRTRPEARLLFSASRGISKEDMEKAVEYIELLKLKHNK